MFSFDRYVRESIILLVRELRFRHPAAKQPETRAQARLHHAEVTAEAAGAFRASDVGD